MSFIPGAVILLGRTNMFRFNNPAEAAKMKKELKKVGQVGRATGWGGGYL